MSCDDIADKAIDIDVEPEQIGDASSKSVLMVGHKVMSMDRHEHDLNVNNRIDQEKQVKGTGLHGHFERDTRGYVASYDDQRGGWPCMLHKLCNLKEVGLHAP